MNQERILIICLSSLGDVLQASFLPGYIKSIMPGAIVHWLVFEENALLVARNPDVDEVLNLTHRKFVMLTQLFSLPRYRYTAVVMLHRNPLFGFLARWTGARVRLGFDTWEKPLIPFLTHRCLYDLSLTRIRRFSSLIRTWHLDAPIPHSINPVFRVPESVPKFESLIPGVRAGQAIVIAPVGGRNRYSEMPARRWTRYREFVDHFFTHYPQWFVVLVGSVDEHSEIARQFDDSPHYGHRLLNLAGEFSLIQLARVVGSVAAFVGNDSFPLFLAISQGTPSLGIFGPTEGSKIVADYAHVRYVQGVGSCAPCYNPVMGQKSPAFRCPNRFECMYSINPEKVVEQLTCLIETPNREYSDGRAADEDEI